MMEADYLVAGKMIERQIDAEKTAEIERLRELNARLLAACAWAANELIDSGRSDVEGALRAAARGKPGPSDGRVGRGLMMAVTTTDREKELWTEYRVRAKPPGYNYTDFLMEKVQQLEEEVEKKPLSQWCDRSENERLREEKAALRAEIHRLRAFNAALLAVCEKLDYYGEALIDGQFDPGSITVTEMVAMARRAVAEAPGIRLSSDEGEPDS